MSIETTRKVAEFELTKPPYQCSKCGAYYSAKYHQSSNTCEKCGTWLFPSYKIKGIRQKSVKAKHEISTTHSEGWKTGLRHLTVRMAWHDNKWNGNICREPELNVYCNGEHSLLSARIARNKNKEIENDNKSRKLDRVKGYQPPCFWSCNAFSTQKCKIKHDHPFEGIDVEAIKEDMAPYSVFTWPFRISFNHGDIRKTEGTYPPIKVLEKNVEEFFHKVKEKETIIFFYLNFDNPISADESKYVLLGCSLLMKVGERRHYEFEPTVLESWRRRKYPRYKNFPTINWAVQLQHDIESYGVLLPYHEYLERIKEHPEEEEKLKQMRVLIEEDALIPQFKYVTSHIDEDQCLYLLYKLRKSLKIIEGHGFLDVSKQLDIIDELIKQSWARRGLYPSLSTIIDIIAEVGSEDESVGKKIVSKIKEHVVSEDTLIDVVFNSVLKENEHVPSYLEEFNTQIGLMQLSLSDEKDKIELFKKLSLFNLTKHQLHRIIYNTNESFKKPVNVSDIIENPYLLAENYKAEPDNLDKPEKIDELIDISKIDVGMIPDIKYTKKRNLKLQNLTQKSPERLRAIIIEYLKSEGENGNCYANADDINSAITNYPIFYKDEELNFDKRDLVNPSSTYYKHFIKRLTIIPNQNQNFIYLNEIYYAEKLVRETIIKLLRSTDNSIDTSWVESYVTQEFDQLKKKSIPKFNEQQFYEERTTLLHDIFKKSIYILSGKPGTGKTFVLEKIISELRKLGEDIVLLAPTGKATLRLKELTRYANAQTIDMYLHREGLSNYTDDFENILINPIKKKKIQTLIIDESSMVNLEHLAILMSLVNLEDVKKRPRILLVGDEKQLPPISFGKPFIDIIDFIKSTESSNRNYIRLRTNCRQEFDEKILEFSDVFGEGHRYYEEILDEVSKGGVVSPGLKVNLWSNKDALHSQVDKAILAKIEFNEAVEKNSINDKIEGLYCLFGLTTKGYLKGGDIKTLKIDNLQIITPYRGNYFGALGLNGLVKSEYRPKLSGFASSHFNHGDKMMSIANEYRWTKNGRQLVFSNGSIGVKNRTWFNGKSRFVYFFNDQEYAVSVSQDEEDNFEFAYAITIHKSQGSDFKDTFVVIPKKPSLLSRELLYTALTRSRREVNLFLEKTDDLNPLEIARKRSFVLSRNTSIFDEKPQDKKGLYEPEKGVFVRSKNEYILYKALKERNLDFEYEKEIPLKGKVYAIHPDFTVHANNKTYFWEHLGILDEKEYHNNWIARKKDYADNGYYENLITTDDLDGISSESVNKVIEDIQSDKLVIAENERFSKHHYPLKTTKREKTLVSEETPVQSSAKNHETPPISVSKEAILMFGEISAFENEMRNFIFESIKDLASDLWHNEAIPKVIKGNWKKRKEDDEKEGKTSETNPLKYADFSDYKEIIFHRWNATFSKYFKDKDKLRVYLDDLNNLCRKTTMHNRTITEDEIGSARVNIRWLKSRMNVSNV